MTPATDSPVTLEDRIRNAEAAAHGFDLKRLAKRAPNASVAELAPRKVLADRRAFLERQLGNEAEADLAFERIIAGNEIQPVRYLECGAIAARAICRITMRDGAGRLRGYGSGFLIAPGVLITNHHVLPDADWAAYSLCEFDYAFDQRNDPLPVHLFRLRPAELFQTSKPLDFSVVAVEPSSQGSGKPLGDFGLLPLIGQVGKVVEGEWLTIIQHPGGDRKSLCVRENRFIRRTDDVLWYTTDTLGGSSGSPVFNNEWQVVALHHAGVPERDDQGRILTVDGIPYIHGQDSEDRIKWVANAGIRVSRIIDTLREQAADHPLLQPLLTAWITPETLRAPPPAPPVAPPVAPPEIEAAEPAFDAPLAPDYPSRPGYDPAFLGDGLDVPLPTLSAALKAAAAKLLAAPHGVELRYLGYSVVQHARRRLPILSAANVDFANRFAMARPTDRWRIDPRIAADQQLGEFYYAGNQFDRGHLTRREDMEYGATRLEALERANDTNHFTNCTPQHSRFNRAHAAWLGLERHLLEDSILRRDFRAIVVTGPVLADDDPAWDRFPDIAYPRRFWKVCVARTSEGQPFATAFLLDQSAAISEYGIEAVPFAPYQTFQLPVKEVERLTGLRFRLRIKGRSRALSGFDPLAKAGVAVARAQAVGTEAAGPAGWLPLSSVRAVVRP